MLVVEWYGRLGNNIYQVINVLHIALYLQDNIQLRKHKYIRYNDIKLFDVSKERMLKGERCDRFFNKSKCIVEFGEAPFLNNHDDVRNLLCKTMNININKSINKINTGEGLVIHIRSGDIISTKPHKLYIPPPLSYYSSIIDSNQYTNITIIAEDSQNPCINALLNKYTHINFKLQSLDEDIYALISCENVICSIGTFCPSILTMSSCIKNMYMTGYDYALNKRVIDIDRYIPNIQIINIPEYYNKVSHWENTKEQECVMLNFKMT